MKTFLGVVHSGRKVVSGSYPLYRLIAFGAFISAILRVTIRNKDDAFTMAGMGSFDYLFAAFSGIGGALILVALYWYKEDHATSGKAHLSFTVEYVGLIFLMTSAGGSVIATILAYDRIPVSLSSWCLIAFVFFGFARLLEISKALREMRKRA